MQGNTRVTSEPLLLTKGHQMQCPQSSAAKDRRRKNFLWCHQGKTKTPMNKVIASRIPWAATDYLFGLGKVLVLTHNNANLSRQAWFNGTAQINTDVLFHCLTNCYVFHQWFKLSAHFHISHTYILFEFWHWLSFLHFHILINTFNDQVMYCI